MAGQRVNDGQERAVHEAPEGKGSRGLSPAVGEAEAAAAAGTRTRWAVVRAGGGTAARAQPGATGGGGLRGAAAAASRAAGRHAADGRSGGSGSGRQCTVWSGWWCSCRSTARVVGAGDCGPGGPGRPDGLAVSTPADAWPRLSTLYGRGEDFLWLDSPLSPGRHRFG